MQRSRLVAGVAIAAAVGAGGVGGALIGVPGLSGASQFPKSAVAIASTDAKGTHPGPGSPLIDAAAKALNLTTEQLVTKLSDGKTTIADVAKQQNVDVNTVIAAMTNTDKDRISDIVNKPWPKFGDHAPGLGRGPGTGFGPAAFGRFGAVTLDPVAKALGISVADLKADLAKGQSIADIAKAKNVDLNKVIDALVAEATTRIDQAVTDKHLTQAQADKIKAGLKTEITNQVNNGFPKMPTGPMGGFGFGGREHGRRTWDGPGSGSSSTTTPTTKAPTN